MELDHPVRTDGASVHARRLFAVDLRALMLLAVLAGCLGLLSNLLRPVPLPLRYTSSPARLQKDVASLAVGPRPIKPAAQISLEALQRLTTSQAGLILDVRPDLFFRAGHIPGALNLARESFGADYARLRPRLEAARNLPIVVYCADADCPDGALVAGALQQLGFRQVVDYPEGWQGWTAAGLPKEQ